MKEEFEDKLIIADPSTLTLQLRNKKNYARIIAHIELKEQELGVFLAEQ